MKTASVVTARYLDIDFMDLIGCLLPDKLKGEGPAPG
jgi:hypothetical protein